MPVWFYSACLFFMTAVTYPALGQPIISDGGIVNAASYAPVGLPNAAIAQGSIFIVFGSQLGPAVLQQVSAFPIAANLAGTSVKVTVSGVSLDCPMIYTSAKQVAAILPSNTPVGNGSLTVTYNGVSSAPARLQVVTSSLGIFSVNQAGSGPGVITDLNYQPFVLTKAAKPGDKAIIWATGIGAAASADNDIPKAIDLTGLPVEVFAGGKPAEVVYRGRSGCCAGLDQIVFTIPPGTEGCYVTVLVKINNSVSNSVTMPISSSNDGVCSDVSGFSASDWRSLLLKPNANVGVIHANRTLYTVSLPGLGPVTSTVDQGLAVFGKYTPEQLNTAAVLQTPSLGSCVVTQAKGNDPLSLLDPIRPLGLDAGAQLNFTGAIGQRQVTATSKGIYSSIIGVNNTSVTGPSPFLDPGRYAIDNGSGGADIGAFKNNFVMPQALSFSNQAAVGTAVDRAKGLTVRWASSDPNGVVIIEGISVTSTAPFVSAAFVCATPAAAGQFTLTPATLLALPVSAAGDPPSGLLGIGSLAVAPLNAPNLDQGFIISSLITAIGVNYQ